MNKRFLCGLAAAGLLLSGCGAGAAETEPPVPTFGSGYMATAPTESAESSRFAFGDEVWSVRRSADGGDAYLVRYMVVSQEGELVAVVPMFNPDPEEVRDVLMDAAEMPLDGTGMVQLVQVGNCYLDPAEAQAAADRENGEG